MAQPAPANWRGAMASAKGDNATRAASQPRNQERKAAPGKPGAARAGPRSSSQPKQRAKAAAPKLPPALSVYEARVAKVKQENAGKASEELELELQRLLQRGSFSDAAYLIEASEFLSSKYKTADVVRLMLENKQFERATQLIREMNMTDNQLLVTLLVKDLVLAAQFHAAVRVAQEMVQGFGKPIENSTPDLARAMWTPVALVQAMIRAQHFRTALKFAKQFELLDTFPVVPLVASMFETRSWADGVSCVMEYRLFAEFPLNVLTVRMLEQRQWGLAIKCMNKLESKDELVKFQEALVQEAARVGDFVTSIMYLREFKLDDPETHLALLQFIVDSMITHGEFYKAIKYAIKFQLAEDLPGAPEDREVRYGTKSLIIRAIQSGQFHVATTYIKKLKLRDEFSRELEQIAMMQQAQLEEFRQYMRLRAAQRDDPGYQMQLHFLLGSKAVPDELVELEPTEVEIVLAETEEFFPRKKKPTAEVDDSKEALSVETVGTHGSDGGIAQSQSGLDTALEMLQISESDDHRQSRFKFAQTTSVAQSVHSSISSTTQNSAPAAPPGIIANPPPASGGFNFAAFASSVQQVQPPGFQAPMPPTQPPNSQPRTIQPPSAVPTMQANAMQPPFPPQSFRPVGPAQPTPRAQQVPPPGMMNFQRSGPLQSSPPNIRPPAGFQPPLPPQPTQPTTPMERSVSNQTASNGGGGSFDIASLAMQFHNANTPASGFASGGFGGGLAPPPPPMGYPGSAMRPYPPMGGGYPGAPPMGPPPYGMAPPPPPPQSTFKPSIGYTTSIITSRPKK